LLVGQAVSPARANHGRIPQKIAHLHPEGAYLFLTWRLWGSLPPQSQSVVYPTAGHAFVAQDRALDWHLAGPRWLLDPPIAELVSQAIVIGECERKFYELRAWVVMPNHVHLLILPKVPGASLMRWLKGPTACTANRLLSRTGQPFWQDESYDHYLRQSNHIQRTVDYIEENPVSAGLVSCAAGWRWSSAGWQAKPPAPQGSASAATTEGGPASGCGS
jgi:putative transposase